MEMRENKMSLECENEKKKKKERVLKNYGQVECFWAICVVSISRSRDKLQPQGGFYLGINVLLK